MLQQKSKKIHKKTINSSTADPFKKYDFDELAISYAPLSKHVHFSAQGVSVIDWKDPEALKELTTAILLSKFKLKYWSLPSKFLCPTVPSRVLYLEYIASLIKTNEKTRGLDIGTGASLIYPILGHKLYNWSFVASEKNPEAFENAFEIQKRNGLEGFIELRLAKEGIFKGIIREKGDFFDFTMCNPPFFENMAEQKTVKWRSSEIKEFEGECEGGELGFLKQMFKESLEFKKNVRIFSSLVGRKSDFDSFKAILEEKQSEINIEIISNALSIGKNRRWVLAWRFLEAEMNYN